MTPMTEERLREIQTAVNSWFDHVYGKQFALELLSELSRLRAREAELVKALELALDAGDDAWSQAPEWYRRKHDWCGEQLDAARAALSPPTPEKR